MAYNEEANIGNAIRSVLSQELVSCEISELVVVASGCTDGTADRVLAIAREDSRVALVVEPERAGKASAINRFIESARCPVLIMVSADVLVAEGSIEGIAHHFHDPGVGMVGGHPVPVNDAATFLGHTVHLLWGLHDAIAREAPKLGEIVAFRNIVERIPTDSAVDEVSLESRIAGLGYRLVYEPSAVVYNRGPSTVADFMRQRRRIAAGHFGVAQREGYAASTMSPVRVARAVVRSQAGPALRRPVWTAGAFSLELSARALGYYDYRRGRSHHIWSAVTTTKADVATSVLALTGTSTAPAPRSLTLVTTTPPPATAAGPDRAPVERAAAVIARAETVIADAELVIEHAKEAIAGAQAVIDEASTAGQRRHVGAVAAGGEASAYLAASGEPSGYVAAAGDAGAATEEGTWG
jgi:hypothetical protein